MTQHLSMEDTLDDRRAMRRLAFVVGCFIAFTVAMLHGPDGKVTGIAAVVRDESARFAQDRELRKRLTELEMQAGKAGN